MASTDVLDITNFKEKGLELHTAIENAVNDTQRYVIQPLPNILVMTQDQYDELLRQNNMTEMYQSKERMYQTNYNVMEVQVKNRTRLTFEEAEKLEVITEPGIGELTDTE